MSMSLNWTQLVAQGRAKAVGIPWSQEELEKLLALEAEGTPRVDAAAILRTGKPAKPRKELEAEAVEAGVHFTEEAPDDVLEAETAKKKKKK